MCSILLINVCFPSFRELYLRRVFAWMIRGRDTQANSQLHINAGRSIHLRDVDHAKLHRTPDVSEVLNSMRENNVQLGMQIAMLQEATSYQSPLHENRDRSSLQFNEMAASIDWAAFAVKYPERPSAAAIEQYTALLSHFVQQRPPSPIQVSRRPEELKYQVNCDDTQWWDGKRETPAKIVDLVLFAYEMDTLEIRLHELDEEVDEFVIVESIYSSRLVPKHLFFANNRERYRKFLPKIIHGIADDTVMRRHAEQSASQVHGDYFWPEDRMRAYAYSTYVEVRGEPDDDTLFIVGDLDELPSAKALAHYKRCNPKLFPVLFSSTLFRHGFRFSFGPWPSPFLTNKDWIVSNGCAWKDAINAGDPHICATATHTRCAHCTQPANLGPKLRSLAPEFVVGCQTNAICWRDTGSHDTIHHNLSLHVLPRLT